MVKRAHGYFTVDQTAGRSVARPKKERVKVPVVNRMNLAVEHEANASNANALKADDTMDDDKKSNNNEPSLDEEKTINEEDDSASRKEPTPHEEQSNNKEDASKELPLDEEVPKQKKPDSEPTLHEEQSNNKEDASKELPLEEEVPKQKKPDSEPLHEEQSNNKEDASKEPTLDEEISNENKPDSEPLHEEQSNNKEDASKEPTLDEEISNENKPDSEDCESIGSTPDCGSEISDDDGSAAKGKDDEEFSPDESEDDDYSVGAKSSKSNETLPDNGTSEAAKEAREERVKRRERIKEELQFKSQSEAVTESDGAPNAPGETKTDAALYDKVEAELQEAGASPDLGRDVFTSSQAYMTYLYEAKDAWISGATTKRLKVVDFKERSSFLSYYFDNEKKRKSTTSAGTRNKKASTTKNASRLNIGQHPKTPSQIVGSASRAQMWNTYKAVPKVQAMFTPETKADGYIHGTDPNLEELEDEFPNVIPLYGCYTEMAPNKAKGGSSGFNKLPKGKYKLVFCAPSGKQADYIRQFLKIEIPPHLVAVGVNVSLEFTTDPAELMRQTVGENPKAKTGSNKPVVSKDKNHVGNASRGVI